MAAPICKLSLVSTVFSLNFALFCAHFNSILDLEEIDDVKYGIDISNTPVLMGSDPMKTSVVYMKSKYGQQYECQLPDMTSYEKDLEEEKQASEVGISELLKPMKNLPCLIKTKNWWTYEFCYGKEIKQYHLEDGKVVGEVISLGLFESEMDWSNTSNTETKRHKANRYHSHDYKNGSLCDLTGKQRETEVRFMCSEEGPDVLYRVDEPGSCSYLLTVLTNRVCKHPYLKPPASHKPKPILCFPALNDIQYEKYLQVQFEEEEERQLRLKAIEDILAKHQADQERAMKFATRDYTSENMMESHDIVVSKEDLVQTVTAKLQTSGDASKSFPQSRSSEQSENDMKTDKEALLSKLFELAFDLDALAQEFQAHSDNQVLDRIGDTIEEASDKLHMLAGKMRQSGHGQVAMEDLDKLNKLYVDISKIMELLENASYERLRDFIKDPTVEELDEDIDDSMYSDQAELEAWLQDFGNVLSNAVHSRVTHLRDGTQTQRKDSSATVTSSDDGEMSHDEDAEDEEDDELEEDDFDEEMLLRETLNNFDDEIAVKELQEGINQITDNENDREKIADMAEDIRENVLQQFDEILAEAKEEFGGDQIFDEIDQREAAKKLAKTLTKLIDSLKTANQQSDTNKEKTVKGGVYSNEQSVYDEQQGSQSEASGDDGDDEHDDMEDNDDIDDDDDDRVRVRVTKINIAGQNVDSESELYDSKYRKIESAIEEHLENAGINPEGKVEVKIIAYDPTDDESGMSVLSEEESTYFKDMIVGILGGGQESSNEERKQRRLEDNYSFVWSSSDSDSTEHQPSIDSDDKE